MADTPTSRTLRALRERGWLAEVVEWWSHRPAPHGEPGAALARTLRTGPPLWVRHRRHDLFGCIDIVAIREGAILGVQATSGSNAAARVTKIREECRDAARLWLSTGAELQVWGWSKYKLPVDRRYWRERIVPVRMEDLE